MRRRAFLGLSLGPLTAGCLSSLPGPTGPRNPPSGSGAPDGSSGTLSVTSFDVDEADDGTLRVFGSVQNRGESTETATVVARVTIDGSETTGSTSVEVPGNGTADYSIRIDVSYASFERNGSVSVGLS